MADIYNEGETVSMLDVLEEDAALEDEANAVLGASDDTNCTYPLVRISVPKIHFRDNVHSHFWHAKRPMAVSFLTPTPPPSSKRPFQSGKIFQHFEGPFFEVALVSLLPRPSQLFFK